MKRNFDIYGIKSDDIDQVADELARIFDIVWVGHESSFKGEYYSYEFPGELGENLELVSNYFDGEDAWLEPNFEAFPTLLYINSTLRSDEIENLLRSNVENILLIEKYTSKFED